MLTRKTVMLEADDMPNLRAITRYQLTKLIEDADVPKQVMEFRAMGKICVARLTVNDDGTCQAVLIDRDMKAFDACDFSGKNSEVISAIADTLVIWINPATKKPRRKYEVSAFTTPCKPEPGFTRLIKRVNVNEDDLKETAENLAYAIINEHVRHHASETNVNLVALQGTPNHASMLWCHDFLQCRMYIEGETDESHMAFTIPGANHIDEDLITYLRHFLERCLD